MNKRWLSIFILILIIIISIFYFWNDEIIDIKEKKFIEKINLEKNKINSCDINSDCNLNCNLLGPVYSYNKNEDLAKINSLYKKYNNLNNLRKKAYRNQISRINCDSINYYCQEGICTIEKIIYCPTTCPKLQLPDINSFCIDGNIFYPGLDFCGCDKKPVCVR